MNFKVNFNNDEKNIFKKDNETFTIADLYLID